MNIAFLLAAGKSRRFGGDKLFAFLEDKPVIWHSLKFLHDSQYVDAIFIAVHKGNKKKIEEFVQDEKFKKVKKIILGGKTRFKSIKNCLISVAPYRSTALLPTSYFIFHNAANPFATDDELRRCIKYLKGKTVGVGVGRPVSSTIKNAPGGRVQKTLPRKNLWEMETPQVVFAQKFLEAVKRSFASDFTDDLAVLEAAGMETRLILAAPRNRKITIREDLPTNYAVGIGEDSHGFEKKVKSQKLKARKDLILGGIKVKGMPALKADSNGDIILHALCNAIAGALGKGSLGIYATRMAKRGIKDSKKYLQVIQNAMERQHKSIHHCSIAIEAAQPKIDPLAPRIKKNLSKLLRIPGKNIGITATSGEKLTPFGRGEGIRCLAEVLVKEQV